MKNATRNMDNKVSYYYYSSQTIITCILYCSYIGEFQSGYPGTMVLVDACVVLFVPAGCSIRSCVFKREDDGVL